MRSVRNHRHQFPGEDGRTRGVPDSTEFIKLRFQKNIAGYAPSGTGRR